MMFAEFVERTGFTPTHEEYSDIEVRYYAFDGNKDEFCALFVKNGEAERICANRAKYIECLKSELLERSKELQRVHAEYEKQIGELKAELEKCEEWKPCSGGTQMDQEDYENLSSSAFSDRLSDTMATETISKEFGFDLDRIKIVRIVHSYESNRYGRMRKAKEYTREPVYASTDWNYICFNCAGRQYEMINGELLPYES